RGGVASETNRGLVVAYRRDPRRFFRREDPLDPVEIRQPFVVIVGEALALDRLAGVIADELERAGAHDVFFVPMLVLIENFFLVDEIEGVGDRRDKGGGREF